MKVLVIGNGAREHALVWKLRQAKQISALFCAPGNPGTASECENIDIASDNIGALLEFAKSNQIDLTIVGPEKPLALGIVDQFQSNGLRIFGPSLAAAKMEASKCFAKGVMQRADVATASYRVCTGKEELLEYLGGKKTPLVLKADGLASGKGVFVCHSSKDIDNGIHQIFNCIGATEVLVEDFLSGVEASFIVATNGETIIPLATSHDYKRLQDGDLGPNTGGMGSVSPTPRLDAAEEQEVIDRVIRPVLTQLESEGIPYCGFLYAGLMLSRGENPNQPKISVVEFNCRLGDPEAQSIMRRFDGDLLELLFALSDRANPLPSCVSWNDASCVCVVLASEGYPNSPNVGDVISGLELAELVPEVKVFHAGTKIEREKGLVTSGGRVLSVTATANDVQEARSRAYKACDIIQFRGRQSRRDIAE